MNRYPDKFLIRDDGGVIIEYNDVMAKHPRFKPYVVPVTVVPQTDVEEDKPTKVKTK